MAWTGYSHGILRPSLSLSKGWSTDYITNPESPDTEKPPPEADSEAGSVITNETGLTTEPGDAEENGTLDSPGRDKESKKSPDENILMEEEAVAAAETGALAPTTETRIEEAPNAVENGSAELGQSGEMEPSSSDENLPSNDNATDYPSEITTL